jgi:hypothetical protein
MPASGMEGDLTPAGPVVDRQTGLRRAPAPADSVRTRRAGGNVSVTVAGRHLPDNPARVDSREAATPDFGRAAIVTTRAPIGSQRRITAPIAAPRAIERPRRAIAEMAPHRVTGARLRMAVPTRRAPPRLAAAGIPRRARTRRRARVIRLRVRTPPARGIRAEVRVSPAVVRAEVRVSPAVVRAEVQASPAVVRAEVQASPAVARAEVRVSPVVARAEVVVSPAVVQAAVVVSPAVVQAEAVDFPGDARAAEAAATGGKRALRPDTGRHPELRSPALGNQRR